MEQDASHDKTTGVKDSVSPDVKDNVAKKDGRKSVYGSRNKDGQRRNLPDNKGGGISGRERINRSAETIVQAQYEDFLSDAGGKEEDKPHIKAILLHNRRGKHEEVRGWRLIDHQVVD